VVCTALTCALFFDPQTYPKVTGDAATQSVSVNYGEIIDFIILSDMNR
jgi:hypothetical protein